MAAPGHAARSCDGVPARATLAAVTTSPLAPAVDAMRTHVPTSRHAEILFEILVDLLGDQGVLWTANERRLRKLFRRDPLGSTLVIPWPIAQLSVGGRIGWVSPTIDTRTGEIVPEPVPAGSPRGFAGWAPQRSTFTTGRRTSTSSSARTGRTGRRASTTASRAACPRSRPRSRRLARCPSRPGSASCVIVTARMWPGQFGPALCGVRPSGTMRPRGDGCPAPVTCPVPVT